MSIQNSHQISDVKILLKQGATGASIVSITKTGTSGLVDTYTVATSDGGRYTFEVTNGSDIQSIEKTSSHGMVDTYTVTLTNGNTTTFEVTNGDNWIDNSEKTATDSFQTITGGLLKMCKVALSPVQSGSGDPSPTNVRPITGHTQVKVERDGKNLFPITLARLKEINTLGTWTGNVYAHNAGVTFTVNVDADGNVINITANGTASQYAYFMLLPISELNSHLSGSFVLNGTPSNGSATSYYIGLGGSIFDLGAGTNFSAPVTGSNSFIYIHTGYTASNLVFKPMIRKSSDTNASFEPYTGETYTVEIPSGTGTVYGGTLDLVSGELVVDTIISTFTGASGEAWDYADLVSSDQFYINVTNALSMDYLVANEFPTITVEERPNKSGVVTYYDKLLRVSVLKSMGLSTVAGWKTWLSTHNLTIAYKIATPTIVQLTPTQVETLVGDNNLLCPLAGQAMVEDGVKYFYIYTYRDLMQGMQDIADALEDDVTEITNNAVEEVSEMAGVWTTPATAEEGDTSITITDASITTSSIIEVYCQNTSGNPVSVTNMTVTTGQAVLSFYALAEDTTFKLHVLN